MRGEDQAHAQADQQAQQQAQAAQSQAKEEQDAAKQEHAEAVKAHNEKIAAAKKQVEEPGFGVGVYEKILSILTHIAEVVPAGLGKQVASLKADVDTMRMGYAPPAPPEPPPAPDKAA